MAATDTTLSVMLFEGGALINALSDKPQGAELATKIDRADRAAFTAGKTDFELTLDPIEVGMALDALLNAQGLLSQNLGKKLAQALDETMKRLGIAYSEGVGAPGLNADDGALSNPAPEADAPAESTKAAAEPAAPEQADDAAAQDGPAEDPAPTSSDAAEEDPDAL